MTAEEAAVRRGSEQDLDECVRLLRLVHDEDGYPRTWPASPRTWLAPGDHVAAWVADDGERVVGHVAVANLDASPATDVWSTVLEVVSSDRGAVALYTRLGWRQVGSLQPEWLPPPDRPALHRPGALGELSRGSRRAAASEGSIFLCTTLVSGLVER